MSSILRIRFWMILCMKLLRYVKKKIIIINLIDFPLHPFRQSFTGISPLKYVFFAIFHIKTHISVFVVIVVLRSPIYANEDYDLYSVVEFSVRCAVEHANVFTWLICMNGIPL